MMPELVKGDGKLSWKMNGFCRLDKVMQSSLGSESSV